jgi:hypothetical protein
MKYYGMTDWARRRDSERMEHVGFREIEINGTYIRPTVADTHRISLYYFHTEER